MWPNYDNGEIKTRNMVSDRASILINLIKKVQAERVAEIGVSRGRTARQILRSDCSDIIKEYWAVDPWNTKYSRDSERNKIGGRDQDYYDGQAWISYKYMCFFPQLKVVRMTSVEASKLFLHYKKYVAGKYFDLVFIVRVDRADRSIHGLSLSVISRIFENRIAHYVKE